MIKFHKEGYKIIFFSLLFFILSNYLLMIKSMSMKQKQEDTTIADLARVSWC